MMFEWLFGWSLILVVSNAPNDPDKQYQLAAKSGGIAVQEIRFRSEKACSAAAMNLIVHLPRDVSVSTVCVKK